MGEGGAQRNAAGAGLDREVTPGIADERAHDDDQEIPQKSQQARKPRPAVQIRDAVEVIFHVIAVPMVGHLVVAQAEQAAGKRLGVQHQAAVVDLDRADIRDDGGLGGVSVHFRRGLEPIALDGPTEVFVIGIGEVGIPLIAEFRLALRDQPVDVLLLAHGVGRNGLLILAHGGHGVARRTDGGTQQQHGADLCAAALCERKRDDHADRRHEQGHIGQTCRKAE